MNACHSAPVYWSMGLASPSLVSRTSRPPSGRSATSTQVPLSVKLDVRQYRSITVPPGVGETTDEVEGISWRERDPASMLEGPGEVVHLVRVGDEPAAAVALDVDTW